MNIFIWAFAWLASIGIFLYIYSINKSVQNLSEIELYVTYAVIIIGIISFLVFIRSIIKIVRNKYPRIIAGFVFIVASLTSLGIGIGILYYGFNYLSKVEKKPIEAEISSYTLLKSPLKIGSSGEEVRLLQAVLKRDSSLYPSGVVSGYYGQLTKEAVINFQKENEISQTGEMNEETINKFNQIYGSYPKESYLNNIPTDSPSMTIQKTQTNVDTDPIVRCGITANCGGGYRNMRNSECNNSTCCQIGGQWIFYTDRNKCNQDQQAYNNSRSNNSPNNNTNQTTSTNFTFPTSIPQNNTTQNTNTQPQQQQAVDNTAAREQCIGNVNSTLTNEINNLRNYCRSIGSGGSCNDTTALESQANDKRAQCYSMYP